MKKLAGFVYVAASNIIRNENISYLSIKFRRVIARSKLEQKTPAALPGKEIVQYHTHDRITSNIAVGPNLHQVISHIIGFAGIVRNSLQFF